MELNQNSDKLIYIQLAEWLTDEILAGTFAEEEKIPSVAELSIQFKMNHITAMKGISLLTDDGIIYKKRGIGMFVNTGAKEMIKKKRQNEFIDEYITKVVLEANKLGISEDNIHEMIHSIYSGNVK